MTAAIVHMCGAFGGKMSGPTPNNRKGMFENTEIRNSIIKPYLRSIKMDPLGQDPLPDVKNLDEMSDLRERVEWAMKWQGFTRGPWFYKGAKLCLIWPLWQTAFPEAKWIIVRRRDDDIARSCARTTFMRAFGDNYLDWYKWITHHKERFEEMKKVLDVREVWPTKFVQGDYSEIESVIRWLGLEWKEEAAREFVNPEWYRSVSGKGSI